MEQEQKFVKIKVVDSNVGKSLYINDTRVSGVKPYSGGTVIISFNVSVDAIINSVKNL